MTQILALPQLAGSMTIDGNADFLVAWRFDAPGGGGPIDLTGIAFHMQVRPLDLGSVALDLSTLNGGLVNGGGAGTLTFWSPAAANVALTPGAYVADLIAEGDGLRLNLFAAAPMTVSVLPGVTR